MESDLRNVLGGLSEHAWNARCIAQLPFTADANLTRGMIHLVDAEGRRMSNFSNDTWGITIGDCYEYCNTEKVPYVSFLSFICGIHVAMQTDTDQRRSGL